MTINKHSFFEDRRTVGGGGTEDVRNRKRRGRGTDSANKLDRDRNGLRSQARQRRTTPELAPPPTWLVPLVRKFDS